jgi:hypothetical protein
VVIITTVELTVKCCLLSGWVVHRSSFTAFAVFHLEADKLSDYFPVHQLLEMATVVDE